VLLAATAVLGAAFLGVKTFEYAARIAEGIYPSSNTFAAVYYLLTGVHALHVLGGAAATLHLGLTRPHTEVAAGAFANRVRALSLYWYFVDVAWLCLFVMLYVV
jgi:cytochrome c oxidase subunit 3